MQDLTRRECLAWLASGAIALPGLSLSDARADEREHTHRQGIKPYRNLVFILIDDLGAIDLACSGSDYYKTPHIDALAKRGARFTHAYAASGVCSPSRASIITGRYPHRNHVTSYIPGPAHRPFAKLIPPANAQTLPDEEVGYAQYLKQPNIRSLHVGKWHLGKRSPQAMGFDQTFEKHNVHSDQDPWAVDAYTNKVCQFIRENKDRRFFVTLSHHTVHVPLYEKSNNIARWENVPPSENGQSNPTMAAMIESMDRSVGRVIQTLKEQGLDRDTAIVFFSDNGGLPRWRPPGESEVVTATSNKPLREGKSTLYEGGIRVPLIIAAPGLTDTGTTNDVPVISNDLAPTFLSLLGIKPQSNQHLDGLDLSPLLKNQSIPERNLFWYYPFYQARRPHAAIRSGDWKLVYHFETRQPELYHLPTDISESHNLADQLPQTTAVMLELLNNHLDHLQSQRPEPNPRHDEKRFYETVRQRPDGHIPDVVATPDPNMHRTLIDILRQRRSSELPMVLRGPEPHP